MLSRVANSIYWMSRYLERADNVARFIDVNTHLMLDLSLSHENTQWYPLVATSGDDETFNKLYEIADEKSVVRFLTFDNRNPNSILSCIYLARENARTVREAIPVEMWERINELYHATQDHSRKRSLKDLQDFLSVVRSSGRWFTGLMFNTMSHDEGWKFARMGQMLERADKTARLLDVKYFLLLPRAEYTGTLYDAVQWGAVLKSADALEMYRQEFHTINHADVAQFLLFSRQFPRSVRHCLDAASNALRDIGAEDGQDNRARAEMAMLTSGIHANEAKAVIASGLHEFIDIFQYNLNLVDTAVHETYFAQ